MPLNQGLDHPLAEAIDDRGVIDPKNLSPQLDEGLPRMRQSTIGTYNICPTRIKFQLEHPDHYGGSDATVIGTAYHAGMEHVLYAHMIGEPHPAQEMVYDIIIATVDQEMTKIGGVDKLSWGKFTSVDELKTKACELYDYRMQYPLFAPEWEIVGIEVPFIVPWNGIAGTGTIDLLLWHPVEGYRNLDHKTAGRMWQSNKHLKSPQPHWYSLMIRTALGSQESVPMDFEIVTYGGKFERRTVVPTPFTEDLWARKAAVAQQVIANDGPWLENVDSNLCSPTYCDAWEWCPSGLAYRRELITVEIS